MLLTLSWLLIGFLGGVWFQWYRESDFRHTTFQIIKDAAEMEETIVALQRENMALKRQLATRYVPYVRFERGH